MHLCLQRCHVHVSRSALWDLYAAVAQDGARANYVEILQGRKRLLAFYAVVYGVAGGAWRQGMWVHPWVPVRCCLCWPLCGCSAPLQCLCCCGNMRIIAGLIGSVAAVRRV